MKKSSATLNLKWIKAKPAVVYQAFQTPEALETWLVPDGMTGKVHHFDWREDGGYEMSLYYPEVGDATTGKTTSHEDRYRSRIISLTPPSEIIQSINFLSDDPDFSGEMMMKVTLEAENQGTLVTILFSNIPPGIKPADNKEGTFQSLEKLAGYIASLPATGEHLK